MCDEHCVSRRASLKCLGAMGAALVLGGAAAPAGAAPAGGGQDKPAASPVDLAVARFSKGHNCSGAVFSAFAERMGIDDATAVRITSGFGGGMGVGSVCGAVTGGIMAIGLKAGGPTGAQGLQTAVLVQKFTQEFKAQHRSINCADLTGVDFSKVDILKLMRADLTKPEEAKAVQEALGGRDFRTVFVSCQGYVRDAATTVDALLKDASKA